MNNADLAFHLIAWKKGLVPKPRLDQALAQANAQGMSLEQFLLNNRDIDSAGRDRVVRTRARHAMVCDSCQARTYLLPGQEPGEVPCDHCGRTSGKSAKRKSAEESRYHKTDRHAVAEDANATVLTGPNATILQPPPGHQNLDTPTPAAIVDDDIDTVQLDHSPLRPPPPPPKSAPQRPPPSPRRPPRPMPARRQGGPQARKTAPQARQSGTHSRQSGSHGMGGPSLILKPRTDPYRIDTTHGTIDGKPCQGFKAGTFSFANIQIQAGACLVTVGPGPLTFVSAGWLRVNGTIDLAGKDGTARGDAGEGGGAVGLRAKTELVIDGTIVADGGRGVPGHTGAGHGGGGGGGAILLQCSGDVTISGTLSATGGAGGSDGKTSGGGGSRGRIRVQHGGGTVSITGTLTPPPTTEDMR